MGFVGVNYEVTIPRSDLFSPASTSTVSRPVRRFLPDLIQLIWDRQIDPGKVFDLTLPLEEAAEGDKAIDERRAAKVLLTLQPERADERERMESMESRQLGRSGLRVSALTMATMTFGGRVSSPTPATPISPPPAARSAAASTSGRGHLP
jgi:hypothetical protein